MKVNYGYREIFYMLTIPTKVQNLNGVIKNSALNIDKNFRTNIGFPSLSKKETIVHIEIYQGKGEYF